MTRVRHGRLGFWLRFAISIIYPLVPLVFRIRWRGRSQVPATGGVLLVVNHISYIDPFVFSRFVYDCGRIPRFLVKDSLFRVFFVRSVLRGARQIPVARGAADAHASLRDAVAALEGGECVCIYPEGTVTRDPQWWPMLAKTGVARLALATDVPVVPVAQWGPQLAVDWYARRFRPLPRKQAFCQAGPAIDLRAYRGRPVTAELLREVTDAIMNAVRDQLAEIRDEAPPASFWRPLPRSGRPPADRSPSGQPPADPPPSGQPPGQPPSGQPRAGEPPTELEAS